MRTINILFLADTSHPAKAVLDHISAITTSDKINWHIVNPLVIKTMDKVDLSSFDAIGIHYSIKPYNYYYMSRTLRAKIAEFRGLKFQFLQDEYQKVNMVQDYLHSLGIGILFTLLGSEYHDKAYPRLKKIIKIPVLTGYVLDYMKNIPSKPIAQRTIDVSYRARRCEYWLGALAYEKQFIADEFIRKSQGTDLNLNISLLESDRIYGDAWLELLKNSKAVLGTESGASIWDFDGSIENQTRMYLKKHRNAGFKETCENVLKPYDYNIVYSAISPRIFEAVATRTPMILFPGDYSRVCQPGKHYIKLEKDFSNFKEVLSQLKDTDFLENLANNAFTDLIESNAYSQHQFSLLIEQTLLKHISSKTHAKANPVLGFTRDLDQHQTLNLIRRVITETHFVLGNFITILFDTRSSFRDKISALLSGVNRYFTYLLARIHKSDKAL